MVVLFLAATALAKEGGEGGPFLATPLDIDILYPPGGAVLRNGNVTAVIEADGESVAYFMDSFANGTFENASLESTGVGPDPAARGRSAYLSPEFQLPAWAPGVFWSTSIEFLTSGSAANLSDLLAIEVRLGDIDLSRNWTAWVAADISGGFGDAFGPGNQSERERGALQYQFTFLDAANSTTLRITQVQIWFIANIESVEARLSTASSWTAVGGGAGRYNFSVALPEGVSTIEARVTDALGATKSVRVNITLDTTAPQVASAPTDGASIPADGAAEIRFSEPVDTASALSYVVVRADFPVDKVWTADNTTLLLSAQESGKRGLVTVTVGPGLRDQAGNLFGTSVNYTYEMGKAPESVPSSAPLLIGILALVGLAGVTVLLLSGRAKKRREEQAGQLRAEMDGPAVAPPKRP